MDLDQIRALAALPWNEAVDSLLNAAPNGDVAPASEKSQPTIEWWHARIAAKSSGIHERMTFFWHTLLTSHRYATGDEALITPQLNMLRANALGNYRTLLKQFTTDGALIKYLDADSSTAERPNENLARELMELFTFGVGHYSEDDVRSAALAMTGWKVDKDSYTPYFDAGASYSDPVTFLGENKKWDVTSIVDRLCDHPETAIRVSSLLWYHLMGSEPSRDRARELGAWWQGQNLEIRPLVARILHDGGLAATGYARPRSGFEFYAAIQSIIGFPSNEVWRARQSGQALYEPPNVAGWPGGERWLTPDSMLRRGAVLFSYDYNKMPNMLSSGDEILDRCGLFVLSQGTLDAFNNARGDGHETNVAQLRWRVAMSCPEFQLT